MADSNITPELVEYWGRKFHDLSEELSQAKAILTHVRTPDALQDTNPSSTTMSMSTATTVDPLNQSHLYKLLQLIRQEMTKSNEAQTELRSMLYQSIHNESDARNRLAKALRDVADLRRRIETFEGERKALVVQIHAFHNQTRKLAADCDRLRRETVLGLFPSVQFLDEGFQTHIIHTRYMHAITDSLKASGLLERQRVYLLPKPPSCMPLRVHACGGHGYWFAPLTLSAEEFELIVEGRPGNWTYLGRYATTLLPGHEMRLAEWMALDEQTKLAYCLRLANSTSLISSAPRGGIIVPGRSMTQYEIRGKHESGEWAVPCYSLRCVGFNNELNGCLLHRFSRQDDTGVGGGVPSGHVVVAAAAGRPEMGGSADLVRWTTVEPVTLSGQHGVGMGDSYEDGQGPRGKIEAL